MHTTQPMTLPSPTFDQLNNHKLITHTLLYISASDNRRCDTLGHEKDTTHRTDNTQNTGRIHRQYSHVTIYPSQAVFKSDNENVERAHTPTHACAHTHIHIHAHACTHIHVHACTHVRTHTHARTHTYIQEN